MVLRKQTHEETSNKGIEKADSDSEKKLLHSENKSTQNKESKTYLGTFKSIIVNCLKGLLIIVIVPAFLNFAALTREENLLKPEGIYIDVKHGQKLFKSCLGTGSPTVLLDAPGGETSDVWSLILPAISKLTKICIYDRAGLGFSERVVKGLNETQKAGIPHTVERMVEDFHKLFETEEKPFILVGADIGAAVAKFYTQLFPDSVASVVLINPLFEGLFLGKNNPWSKYWFNVFLPSLQLQHICSALGLTRIGLQTGLIRGPLDFTSAPEVISKRQKYLRCKPAHVSAMMEERYFLNETLLQARTLHKIRPFPIDVPISLLWTERYSENLSKERNQVWLRSQEMFSKSFNGKQIVETLTLKGYLPKSLLTEHKIIVKHIVKVIQNWRTKSKHYAKY